MEKRLQAAWNSRQGVKAADHDFNPEIVLKPFGIFLPYNKNYFYFTDSNVTADPIILITLPTHMGITETLAKEIAQKVKDAY